MRKTYEIFWKRFYLNFLIFLLFLVEISDYDEIQFMYSSYIFKVLRGLFM